MNKKMIQQRSINHSPSANNLPQTKYIIIKDFVQKKSARHMSQAFKYLTMLKFQNIQRHTAGRFVSGRIEDYCVHLNKNPVLAFPHLKLCQCYFVCTIKENLTHNKYFLFMTHAQSCGQHYWCTILYLTPSYRLLKTDIHLESHNAMHQHSYSNRQE